MKKLFAVLVAVAIAGESVMAQDVIGLKQGSESLNFTFGGLSTLGTTGAKAGPTTGFGMSYFLNSDAALRIGLQLGYASETIPSNIDGGTDGSASVLGLGLSVDYLKYMLGATSRVHPYVGAGIAFSFTSTDQKSAVGLDETQKEVKNGVVSIDNFNNIGGGITLGVLGIGGVEFFIYPEISLSAEYDLNIVNFNIPSDVTTTGGGFSYTTKNTTTTQVLGFSAANLGIHIYF
jgi:Outer membrane protein beta-barrel domain